MMGIYNDEFRYTFPGLPVVVSSYRCTPLEQLCSGRDMVALSNYLVNNPESASQVLDKDAEEKILPLAIACVMNNQMAAEVLLCHGAKVDGLSTGVNCSGKYYTATSLHLATFVDSLEMVKFLVKAGADVNARMEPSGYTALHIAVSFGYEKIAIFLVHECNADPNIPSNEDYCNYPIMKAVFKMDCRMLLLLLNSPKIDPNVTDSSDCSSVLHYAVMQRSVESVSLLLNNNADPNLKLCTGHTPLDIAYNAEVNDEMKEMLEARGAKRSERKAYVPFIFALRDSKINKLKIAVHSGANVNCRLFEGVRLLHHAIELRQIKVIRLLLSNGADVTAADDYGTTALHYAAARDDVTTIHQLLKRGADVNAADSMGQTPLHRAAESGASSACSLLIQCGAMIGVDTKELGTPLALATMYGCPKTVKILLDAGENPNVLFSYLGITDCTPLYVACIENNFEMMKELIAKGANPNAHVCAGNRIFYPMDYLRFSSPDSLKAFIILIEAGAFFDIDTIPQMRVRGDVQTSVPTFEQVMIEKNNWLLLHVYQSTVQLFHAVRRNDLAMVKKCVAEGGLINCCSYTYDTPLIFASYKGSLPMVDYLLENGAKMYMTNVTRSSPLHYAAKYDRREVAVRLLRAGARVSYLCKGRTAIQLALEKGHREMVSLLVFVGRYLLETRKQTVSPIVKYKTDPTVVKVLQEMGDKRPPKKLIAALFSK